MRVINVGVLDSFCRSHADCRDWIANWLADVRAAKWATPEDLKQRFPSASILAKNVVIFNVRGNNYRLETQITYQLRVIYVRWIGTHAEYSKR